MSSDPDPPARQTAVPLLERPEVSYARPRVSFAGRVTAGFLAILVVMAGLAALGTKASLGPWSTFLLVLLVAFPFGAWLITRLLRPIEGILEDLSDGIRSFRDRDFSVRLQSRRSDEFGQIAQLYNEVGTILQSERRDMRERELLLQAALNQSPVAIALVNHSDRVIYSNQEAGRLLLGGAKL